MKHVVRSYTVVLFQIVFMTILANKEYPKEINVGHIYSDERNNQAKLTMDKAVGQLQKDGVIPTTVNFNYDMAYACLEEEIFNVSAYFMDNNPPRDVLFGPTCTAGMNIGALFASFFNIPIMGYISVGDNLANKTKYPTLVRSSFSMGPLGMAVKTLLNYYHWKNIAIIRSPSADCDTSLSGIYTAVKDPTTPITLKADISAESESEIRQALSTLSKVARITILCFGFEPISASNFLITAYQQGMTNPEYVYILPYYLKYTDSNWIPWQQPGISETDKAVLQLAYQRVLLIEASGVDTNSLQHFQDQFVSLEHQSNFTGDSLEMKEALYLPFLHDAMYLYGVALNKTIRRNGDYRDGKQIVAATRLVKFTGVTGSVVMSNGTDRVPEYFVFGPDNMGNYTFKLFISANLLHHSNSTAATSLDADDLALDISILGDGIDYWPTPDGKPPLDTPICGFSKEKCSTNYTVQIACAIAGAFVIIILLLVFSGYQKRKHELNSVMRMSWKVHLSELKILSHSISLGSGRAMSKMSGANSLDVKTPVTIVDFPESDFTAYCMYRGTTVFSKSFEKKKQLLFSLDELLLLKSMKEVRHDNVNYFIGMVTDDGPFLMVLWKYCEKGSLQDIIYNEDIHLDITFVASIMKDMISGLEYIHKSHLQVHGNLTTRNCLVDSRWTVKLTDYGLPTLFSRLAKDGFQTDNTSKLGLFHRAPEQLRMVSKELLRTKPADIYSLSIVMYQVLFRIEPFADEMLNDNDILNNIRNGGNAHVRPVIPRSTEANPALIELMQRCWNEDPVARPAISEVKSLFTKSAGKLINISLMDHVMSMLEKYATNLEKIVDERTQQLVQERKRADQLLYQMLPRVVADKLKIGEPIYPETYDAVTIYFSDIVSFTVLSSMSTPMQIVAFLNKLYSQFDETILQYDVYKVETIGDAYMVVSGLPHRNGSKHVTEISDMALGILQLVIDFKIPHMPERKLEIRIGLHSGSVAAGVVGLTMPRFCLFGDAVNTASRMESSGKACKIQISENCQALLVDDGNYSIEPRGTVEIKGKGLQNTYWLLGKRMYGNQKNSNLKQFV